MSFNAQNPLSAAKLNSSPPPPIKGARGLFPKEDGWYDVDDSGVVTKIASDTEIKEALSAPRTVLAFDNGMILEAREDGVYVVNESFENKLVDIEGLAMAYSAEIAYSAEYAREADLAHVAAADEEYRPLKGQSIEDIGDYDSPSFELKDGNILSYGIVSTSLVANLPNSYQYIGFLSALYFTTPSIIPENYTQFPDSIYFKGDSTNEGAFVPEADMRYTIGFDFDGYMLNGYVSGVPAPTDETSEVTE